MKYRLLGLSFLVTLITGTALAQTAKPWHEWTKQDVERMLNKSAWGQTQAETDTSEMVYSSPMNDRSGVASTSQAMTFNYRIRLFSARPIREAFARQLILGNPNIKPAQLENFVIGDYSEVIVVAVTFDGADRRWTGIIGQTFEGATTASVKNKAYLERSDGKRFFPDEYAKPSSDGTGAKFVFARMVDGKPFVTDKDEFIRFVADMGRGVEMSWKFKISDMIYNGKLEY